MSQIHGQNSKEWSGDSPGVGGKSFTLELSEKWFSDNIFKPILPKYKNDYRRKPLIMYCGYKTMVEILGMKKKTLSNKQSLIVFKLKYEKRRINARNNATTPVRRKTISSL